MDDAPADDASGDGSPDDAPTDSEAACFEAGIKFGSLYHQFAGTPVSPESAASLAAAMEAAIENQPHCTGVTVDVDESALAATVAEGPADYTELTGRLFDADVRVEYEGHRVHARMRTDGAYPLMELVSVERGAD
jgi:hypothetical protein